MGHTLLTGCAASWVLPSHCHDATGRTGGEGGVGAGAGLTRTMWPVEMSMLGSAGSSDQDEVLLRAGGLGIGPSLNCEDTLLMRDPGGASGRSAVRTAMRWRQSSWETVGDAGSVPPGPWPPSPFTPCSSSEPSAGRELTL